jgi:hypothetical protein
MGVFLNGSRVVDGNGNGIIPIQIPNGLSPTGDNSDIIDYWVFDSSAEYLDGRKASIDLTEGGAAAPTKKSKVMGLECREFNGLTENFYASATGTAAEVVGDVTVEVMAWIGNAYDFKAHGHQILMGYDAGVDNPYSIQLGNVPTNLAQLEFQTRRSTLYQVVTNMYINFGGWYWITVTKDGTTREVNIYVNGMLVTTGTIGANANFTGGGVLHFGSNRVNGRRFAGYLAGARLFDVELTPAEVLISYNQSLGIA